MRGKATLEEATVPARFRLEEGGHEGALGEIPNLLLVPRSSEMKSADMAIILEPADFAWFVEIIKRYQSGEVQAADNEVWLLDLPANYGRLTVSVLQALDEDDEVLPPLLVTGKEGMALGKLVGELADLRKELAKRSMPARPTVHHILLCSTPTSTHNAAEYHLTIEAVENAYPGMVLPYVRYSGVAAGQYSRQCPTPISEPKSFPSLDYAKVADALGFPDLTE